MADEFIVEYVEQIWEFYCSKLMLIFKELENWVIKTVCTIRMGRFNETRTLVCKSSRVHLKVTGKHLLLPRMHLIRDYQCSLKTFTNGGEKTSRNTWSTLVLQHGGHSHTISSCSASQTNHQPFHSLFPLRSNRLKGSDPVSTCTREVACLRKAVKAVKPFKATIQDTAKNIYFKTNQPFNPLTPTPAETGLKKRLLENL